MLLSTLSHRGEALKIYTRRGDGGRTGLFGGGRVPKDHLRVEAYGTVDELNALIGIAAAQVTDGDVRRALSLVQSDLFAMGARLATPARDDGRPVPSLPDPPLERAAEMESWIDRADGETGPLRSFVLPAGSAGACRLHHARTVCRRAERRVVALAAAEPVAPWIVQYLNRLSDYLFAAARLENALSGAGDVPWTGSARS